MMIGNTNIPFSPTAKILGVIIDRELSFKRHSKYIKRSCIFHVRHIKCIRKYITKEAAVMLVHSLVMSRIDYCNSLFSGCNADTIADLQSTL